MAMLILHELLSVVLFYTGFCRAVHMSTTTRTSVRLAFWALSIAAVVCIFSPLSFNWQPDFVSLILLAAIVIVQCVTAVYWQHGTPPQFCERLHDALRQ